MKVVLFCSSGYSSSVVMKNMQKCIQEKGRTYQLEAYAVCESAQAQGSDIILLSPQVRFNLAKIQSLYPAIPVVLIKKEDFQKADGEAILRQIDTIMSRR